MVSEVGDVVSFGGRDCEVVQVAEAYRECYGLEPARCQLKSVLDGDAVEWTDLAKFEQASQGGACKVYVRRLVAKCSSATPGDHDESGTLIVAPWKTGKAGRGDF